MGWEMAEDNRAAGTVPADEPKRPADETQQRPSAGNQTAQTEVRSTDADNGKKPKKEKKKHGCFFKLFITVVVLLALCIGGYTFSTYQKEAKEAAEWENTTYTWPTSGLAALLPQPESEYGEVETYSNDSLSVEVRKIDKGAYGNYVEACKAKGFTEDATSSSSSYTAFDKNGNRLRVSYSSYSEKPYMTIDLDAAPEMSDIVWPTSGAGASLPAPATLRGSISTDKAESFSAKLAMDKDTFSAYVDTCVAAGFDVDSSRSDTSYRASNAEGTKLEVIYQGGGVCSISAKATTSETKSTESAEPATTSEAQPAESAESSDSDAQSTAEQAAGVLGTIANVVSGVTSNVVTPEFKEFVDSYEAFMNEYCDFMVKYNGAQAANDTATLTTMTADYTSLVQQELEWIDKMNAVDQTSLSAADDAYYLAAIARVEKKLVETGLSAS